MWPPRIVAAGGGARLALYRPASPEPVAEVPCLARLLRPGHEPLDVPISAWRVESDELSLEGARGGWSARSSWTPRDEGCDFLEAVLELTWEGDGAVEAGLRLPIRLPAAPEPAWLIPGAFYRENRPEECSRPYPRHDRSAPGTGEGLVSDDWSFRSDRAALAAVFAWGIAGSVGLCGDESGPLGLTGLGFAGRGEDATIWLDMPYREEPVRYVGLPEPFPPQVRHAVWEPGRAVRIRYQIRVADPGPHAYDPFLRAMYRRRQEAAPLRPWMGVERAARLTAEGLTRWHFRRVGEGESAVAILAETAAFDRELGDGRGGSADREDMHVAWVSGAPWSAALLRYGRLHGDSAAVEAGVAVLDTIASGLSPSGTFWGEWRAGRGWTGGWNPSGWLHARTVSEATLFLLRAVRDERAAGILHPAWEAAAGSSLSFAAAHQREDGNLGLYYHPQTGEVKEWGTAAGLPWIAAFLLGAQSSDVPEWRHAATRAGRYYARFVEGAFIHGAVEDVPSGPSSEDGYAAVMAYVALHEADPAGGWLHLARRAADWTMTFRYAYNVRFPDETLLGAYDFRSRGADQASSCNQHLHAYGLICLPEMLALWRATGDRYYLERSVDNLACFLQLVARDDGDFNARRGMVSERYYQTDCFGPPGGLLTLSHAWSVGVLLHACLHAVDEPDLTRALTPVDPRP